MLEQGGQFAGINRKVQLKPLRWSAVEEGSGEQPRCVEALLILKHGGVLTHAGRQQVLQEALWGASHNRNCAMPGACCAKACTSWCLEELSSGGRES